MRILCFQMGASPEKRAPFKTIYLVARFFSMINYYYYYSKWNKSDYQLPYHFCSIRFTIFFIVIIYVLFFIYIIVVF